MFNEMLAMGSGSGGADMSPLFGKVVISSMVQPYTVDRFFMSCIGINTIRFAITAGTGGYDLYGWVGETETLIGSYTKGTTQTVDVSSYERLSGRGNGGANATLTDVTVID